MKTTILYPGSLHQFKTTLNIQIYDCAIVLLKAKI